jgi:hypothetical protein
LGGFESADDSFYGSMPPYPHESRYSVHASSAGHLYEYSVIPMKHYLITMAVLLLLSIIAGIIVWYLYQDMNPKKLMVEKEITPLSDGN